MKILAIEKEIEGTSREQFAPHLKAEAKRVWELNRTGVISEIYFTQNSHNAVVILECANEAEAKSILDTLPLVKEKLITFDLLPLLPYSGFERLFN
jgi:hypothetical protein